MRDGSDVPLTQFLQELPTLVGIGEMCSEQVEVRALVMRSLSRPAAENDGNRADELREDASTIGNGLIGQRDDLLRCHWRRARSLQSEWR